MTRNRAVRGSDAGRPLALLFCSTRLIVKSAFAV